MSESVKDYLARIGRKGGKAKGAESKARGDAEYYRQLRAKGVRKARRAK
jgi:hypothetical protein